MEDEVNYNGNPRRNLVNLTMDQLAQLIRRTVDDALHHNRPIFCSSTTTPKTIGDNVGDQKRSAHTFGQREPVLPNYSERKPPDKLSSADHRGYGRRTNPNEHLVRFKNVILLHR